MSTSDLRWRKSSRSGSGGQTTCVEVAAADGTWYVRDSKDPEGGWLAVGRGQWVAFLAQVKSDLG